MRSIIEVTEVTDGTVYSLASVDLVRAVLPNDTAEDEVIEAQIEFYSKLIAAQCDRVFAQQEVTETFVLDACEHPKALLLSRYPVASISLIEVDGSELDEDAYEVVPDSGMLYLIDSCWTGSRIAVTYTGGYSLPDDAPAPLAEACIEWVKDVRLSAGRDPTVRDVTHGDLSVSYWTNEMAKGGNSMPPRVSELIQPYRRWSV